MKFATNKNIKYLIIITLITVVISAIFSAYSQHKDENSLMTKEISTNISTEINNQLPIRYEGYSLIKTKVTEMLKDVYSIDFYYAMYINKNEIDDYNKFSSMIVKESCNNELTKKILNNNGVIRHQFVTKDKELLPLIGVTKRECV